MKKTLEKKERIFGFDFTRSICAIIIICFHFAFYNVCSFKLFNNTANGSWGDIINTVFFILSGAVIYYNYPKIESKKEFYFKRWKSIFPAFYLSYLIFYPLYVYKKQSFLWGGNILKYIFTILGIDNYLSYRMNNYFIVGEWFLGAIIIIYVLYPLVIWMIKKYKYLLPLLLIIGYALIIGTDLFIIPPIKNIITCLTSFYLGILLVKNNVFIKKDIKVLLVSLLLFIILYFIRIDLKNYYILLFQIQGFLFFLIAFQIGEFIKNIKIKNIILYVSKLSYIIFLIQHLTITIVLHFYNPSNIWLSLLVLICITVGTIIMSKIISLIVNRITSSKMFLKLENKVLNNNI